MMRVYALGILGRFSLSLSDGTRIASGRTVSVSAQALGFRGAARQLAVIEAITTVSRLNIDNAAHSQTLENAILLVPAGRHHVFASRPSRCRGIAYHPYETPL